MKGLWSFLFAAVFCTLSVPTGHVCLCHTAIVSLKQQIHLYSCMFSFLCPKLNCIFLKIAERNLEIHGRFYKSRQNEWKKKII